VLTLKKLKILFIVILMVILPLAACTSAAPDPCSDAVIQETLRPIQELMFAFDDTTALANILPKEVLVNPIMDLQKNRRALETMVLPTCLETLQKAGVSYMNSVIAYMGYFLVGVDQQTMTDAISGSNNLRVAYEQERARLLKIAFTPPSTATPGIQQPAQTVTFMPTEGTAITLTVTNTSKEPINLRSAPLLSDSQVLSSLPAGATATAVARVATSDWLQLNVEDQLVWVYAPLVQVTGDISLLPIYGQNP
jgi:hypothetical protein